MKLRVFVERLWLASVDTATKKPVLCVEMEPGQAWSEATNAAVQQRLNETKWAGVVVRCLVHTSFPVDPRHNSKIKREALKVWAEQQCGDLIGVLA